MGLEEFDGRGQLRAARRVAVVVGGELVALAGDHALGGLTAAAELDQLQAVDALDLRQVEIIDVALVGVAADALQVGLLSLRERVAERQVVARPRLGLDRLGGRGAGQGGQDRQCQHGHENPSQHLSPILQHGCRSART